jgi:hypothetical protein
MGQNLGFIYTRTHLFWRQDQEANFKEVWQMKEVWPRQSFWSALDRAGPCCKAFAESVPKAATVIAGHHGWNVPVVGCLRVRYLSKLEQDTMRLH